MREITLTDYLADGGKAIDVARTLNVTAPAITKMVKTNRDVRLIVDLHGKLIRGYEIKRFANE